MIKVLEAGFITTVQDLGRTGNERYGVPVAGAMDRFALAAANRLVGNPVGAAAFEFAVSGPTLLAGQDGLVALGGPGFSLDISGHTHPAWMAVFVRRGQEIRIENTGSGMWGVLAVEGGIQTQPVLGSRSTYIRGSFGGLDGRLLVPGDLLPLGPASPAGALCAGRILPAASRPNYQEAPTIEVILGPQDQAFTPAGIETFLNSEYHLSVTADRMGYRFEGAAIQHASGADIISDGIAFGAVQVPASGQPIVMMSDRQTTGGYTKIAVVASADLPVLAQCRPGVSRVRFRQITVEAAQVRYRALLTALERGIEEPDELNLNETNW